jgi:hypothetical protein
LTSESPAIPETIDEVTPPWLTAVLAGAGAIPAGSSVTSLDLKRIGEEGLMGEIYRVGIAVDPAGGEAPSSVVVKLPSRHEGSRAQGVALGMYEAEVRFYNELGPSTPTGLPAMYHAAIRPGTAEFVIVMEDLGHLSLVDQLNGMTAEQAAAALRILADVHAAWWGRVQVPELEWIPTMTGDRIAYVDQLLPQLWPVAGPIIADALPPGGAELGEAFSHSYLKLQQRYSSRPWTLVHQDYRVDNLLVGNPADDEVVVIDWQGIGRGPAGYDVAYLLGGSMKVEDRRTHERELVAAYHQRLSDRGVEYSFEQVWDDYCYAHALGGLAVTLVAAATLDTTSDRSKALVACMAERHFTAALDHHCGDLMG